MRSWLSRFYRKIVDAIIKTSPFTRFNNFITASKHEFGLIRCVILLASYVSKPFITHRESASGPEIAALKGDLILIPDAIWTYNFWDAAIKAKNNGALVVALIHDIIPISHPQFAGKSQKEKFEFCLSKMSTIADGYLGNSNFTTTTLLDFLEASQLVPNKNMLIADFFHLGAELDTIKTSEQIRPRVRNLFSTDESVYLMVGTIEPRKNHLYSLQVFSELWEKKINAKLVIVGRIGWLCDEIVQAIRYHPMFGKYLFLLTDTSDAELEFCYMHAKALIFPTIVEGFGLPIIEAQQKGLPVFASDLTVLREVASDSAAYFDNTVPQTLADMLYAFETEGVFPAKGPESFNWPDWEVSTRDLISKLLDMTKKIEAAHKKNSVIETAVS
jgi:alpha-1,2-rhamnosyltransferase